MRRKFFVFRALDPQTIGDQGEHSNYDQGLGLGFRYDALKTNPFDTKMRTDSTLLFLPHYSRTFQPNFAAKLTQGI
ncbi:hypothetical protein TWF217_011073 [Orbilia oligospora]|nr:hypothetical protein TWF128_001156 [Orbilia oligospora]KAF3268488.1 hypothetical protein TWF217_011073 [Orbilia oligospora]